MKKFALEAGLVTFILSALAVVGHVMGFVDED
jgi:hypothetical protein